MATNTDIFRPDNKTIEEIFGDTEAFYNMPIYQRPYAWDKERVEQLWYDMLEAYKNNLQDESIDKNYFLGSVVVVDKDKHQDVVDGQQRLTTLTILFCTLRDLNIFNDNEEKINILKDSIQDFRKKKQRLKLTTHSNNQALFEETIINGIDFNKSKKDIKNNRFLQTSYYFKNLILKLQDKKSEDNISSISEFINYIFNKTTMIKVVCYDENFAIKLFSVLNDRGLDLTPADIIKAYLMESMVDDEIKLNSFIEVWKQIESIIEFTDEKMEGILNLYLYYLITQNPKKSLQDELKQQFKNKDSQKIILDIKKFAENYSEIVNSTQDNYISMLKYLSHNVYWKSILVTAKHTNYKESDKLKIIITRYFYQSWIAGGTSNRIKQTAFNILKSVKNGISIDNYTLIENDEEIIKDGIKTIIEKNLNKYDNYKQSLSGNYLYWERWLKPLLLSVEYFENEKKDFIPITRDLQIEHILPQTWNAEKSWDGVLLNWKDSFSEDEAERLINSLGNLTLLTGKKNIEASNCNYDKKIDIYKGNSGKGFDGKSSFEITKSIIDNYNVWTKENIEKRYNILLEKIDRILKI
ncbi:MAG TPA: DUF262 domain-containing protein [Arcobacter sp.]|nr:DUF262 domain-containing protein [Arcobacter sp.]